MDHVRFSIIIPTANEEENIVKCLKSIIGKKDCMKDTVFETIIVDGASRDRTIKNAEEFLLGQGLRQEFIKNFKIIKFYTNNLPLQLNEGAKHAKGEILLFLHADSTLPMQAFAKIDHLFKKRNRHIGGAFSLLFNEKGFFNSLNSFFGNLYSCIAKIYFGDRMIFVKRSVFLKLCGFKDIPIMSDVDFSIRMKDIGKTSLLKGPVYTSPRGIAGDSLGKRATLILWALYAYRKGIDPEIIKEKYYGGYSRER